MQQIAIDARSVEESEAAATPPEVARPEMPPLSSAPPAPALVSVSHLTKSYGTRRAVSDVSFELAPGVTGLLGPNGAGKSTLVRCLSGLCGWDDGEVRIAGVDPAWRARDARSRVGYMPERVSFPPEMRVDHYLRFAAEGKGLPRSTRRSAVEGALERAGLLGVRSRIITNLSKGYRQRVGLAQALLGDPPVLILDEPSAGLDPLHVIEIRAVLSAYAEGRAVLVSTHSLGETRRLCSRVLVLSQGRLVYDGSTAGMTAAGCARFRMRVSDTGAGRGVPPVDEPGTVLSGSTFDAGEYELVVEADDRLALGRLVARLSTAGWLVTAVEPAGDPLEDAFRRAVGDRAAT
ncbi:MAG TPA: ABC transporter ATP-binding protein [Acidimicrobiia bacterium]|nr:ABC transporter ATP-binding protein [Acidimicrobiia bacterium]